MDEDDDASSVATDDTAGYVSVRCSSIRYSVFKGSGRRA